jgi:hypothetical protein
MLKSPLGRFVLLGCSFVFAAPAAAQTPPAPAAGTPPTILQITREEVRAGKGAAHAVNEAAWAAAFVKAQSPIQWIGMSTLSGPTEAWFLSGYESYDAMQKSDASLDANAALQAEQNRLSAIDGDLLSRTSSIIARYRPALSYQPGVSLPTMRYMTVDMVRVKAGHVAAFADAWRMMVEAHKKANLDEHWAVFEVESGMLDTTYLFMYPHKSLAEIDASGPMHGTAFRDVVGDAGRRQMDEAYRSGVEMTQTIQFQFRPAMSALSADWATTDPFWTLKPAPVVAAKPVVKKKQ